MPSCVSAGPVKACTESDTCSTLSSRRWAVTTISSSASLWPGAVAGGACCASAGALITGSASRDTANKRKGLEMNFIDRLPLLSLVERLWSSLSLFVIDNNWSRSLLGRCGDPDIFDLVSLDTGGRAAKRDVHPTVAW